MAILTFPITMTAATATIFVPAPSFTVVVVVSSFWKRKKKETKPKSSRKQICGAATDGMDGFSRMRVGWRRDYGPLMLDRLASYMKKGTHTHYTHMHVK